jgi:hypothetical protein
MLMKTSDAAFGGGNMRCGRNLTVGLLSIGLPALLILAGCSGIQTQHTGTPARQSISVTISPATVSVQSAQNQLFTVTMQNDSLSQGVSWSLSGAGCAGAACGTLRNPSATGVTYGAPSVAPNPPTVTLTATSIADTSKSANATISVSNLPAIAVSVSPASTSVQVAQTATFSASVQNDQQSRGVIWSVAGSGCSAAACGTLTNVTALGATYNAPSIAPNPPAVTLTATSAGDTSKTAFALITITSTSLAQRVPLGTNLSGMDDWSTEITFVDAFRNSRPWFSRTQSVGQDQRPLDLDAHGWVRSLLPGQWAATLMFWDLSTAPGQYPAGQYVVTYAGSGTLAYGGAARVVSQSPGRDVIDVDPARGGGIGLYITSTNAADYIRNIQVFLPGFEKSTERFYPIFLETIQNYKAIRFVHWMLGQDTNLIGTTQIHWTDRPQPDDARWSVRGVPVEIMVELANRLHADPWFNIPHVADDDYVKNFAHIVATQLDPSLKAYVEDSNEVWNGQYPQAQYARQQGVALGLSSDPFVASIRYHAMRSRQIFDIFEQELPPNRLVRVLGSHVDNLSVTTTALSYADTPAHVDAVAVAPYFGIFPGDLARVRNMTPEQLLADMAANAVPTEISHVRQHITAAKPYGLPVISYEGGQSLTTSGGGPLQGDPQLEALFDATNRDLAFGPLYSSYLQQWNDTGAGLFMHYSNCFRYGGSGGRFGSLEYINQPRNQAPKYDALQKWIEGQ